MTTIEGLDAWSRAGAESKQVDLLDSDPERDDEWDLFCQLIRRNDTPNLWDNVIMRDDDESDLLCSEVEGNHEADLIGLVIGRGDETDRLGQVVERDNSSDLSNMAIEKDDDEPLAYDMWAVDSVLKQLDESFQNRNVPTKGEVTKTWQDAPAIQYLLLSQIRVLEALTNYHLSSLVIAEFARSKSCHVPNHRTTSHTCPCPKKLADNLNSIWAPEKRCHTEYDQYDHLS